jgi:predicted phage-related endonuclease
MSETPWKEPKADRRYFVGGSDARVIMGDDEAALLRLWREKRGEIEPELDFADFCPGFRRRSRRLPLPQ